MSGRSQGERSHLRVVQGGGGDPGLEAERHLVERARVDSDAFGLLFDRYHDPILSYLLHLTADLQAARELTSNTFYRALAALPSYRWRGVPFSAWLYRIASNEAAGRLRRLRRRRFLPLGDSPEDLPAGDSALDQEVLQAEEALDRNRRFAQLHRHLRRLPYRDREALVLHYFQGKTVREMAAITGRSPGTVKARLHRARRRLESSLRSAVPAAELEP